jgi:subtilase family serine protease
MSKRRLAFGAALGTAMVLAATGAAASAAPVTVARAGTGLADVPIAAPRLPGLVTAHATANTDCVMPDGTHYSFYHCYTPRQIRAAYGVSAVAPITVGGHRVPNLGQGQTIVLVDSYGSPTAAADLAHFHAAFFPTLPAPSFKQIFPQGNPQFPSACHSNGLAGPCAAANWSGEASLDIEWAYSIAPLAHIVLLAVPPAETEGVQGFPNLFKAIAGEIAATPRGTVFSLSLSATEQAFGGAAAAQTAKFDQVFKAGLARHDNFFAATGDYGSASFRKQHKEGGFYPFPVVGWPATSPYVVAVGGTQLQDGWTWNPSSNVPFTSTGFNPAYWASTRGGHSQAVWNESWGPIGTGGGASVIYPRPSWQQGVDPGYGNHRLVPDTAWNAAVNGGVDVYITAYPEFNCGNTTGCWTFFGGTSAATPQTAALVALVNAARAAHGKQPIGFLDPLLYHGVGATAYTDIVAQHYGSAGRCSSRSATCRTTSCGRCRSPGTRPPPGMTRPPAGVPRRRQRSSAPWRRRRNA